jgi:hypothetical protein
MIMKQLFTFLFLVFFMANTGNAQVTSPSNDNEYCPLTDLIFTVTFLGTNPSISSYSGGPVVAAGAYDISTSSGTTSFKFKANFRDVNIKQEFQVSYKDASNADATFLIPFKKIKSLFYPNIDQSCARIQPNFPVIQAPHCQLSTINLSFANLKYVTEFENPKSCFGNITTYEYLLPAGWKLNTTTSNGSTWLSGDNSESITSDATTGGVIQVRATNTGCAGILLQKGQPLTIPINRASPVFTVSPASVAIACTSTPTYTFSVNTSATLACPITYDWNLGASNGWSMGGSPAPATLTTSTNSITLTSQSGTVLPSSVKVIPVLNGVNQPEITVPVTWTTPNYGMIGGTTELCTGTSYPFSIYNTTSGSTFFWSYIASLPNYGASVVTVNTPTAGSTSITKIGDGVIDMHCTVTNTCAQTTNLVRPNVKVGGYSGTSSISGYTLAYPPCYTPLCTPPAVANPIAVSGPFGTTVFTGVAYYNTENNVNITVPELETGTWSLVTGTVAYWWAANGNFFKFYPDGGTAGSYVKFRLTKNTACGNQYYDFDFRPTTYNPPFFRVGPNPTKGNLTVSIDQKTVTKGIATVSAEQEIREITIFDKMGRQLRKQSFGKGTRQTNLNVTDLQPGLYVLRIFNGKEFSTVKFMKE